MIRILIADDHTLMRDGLKQILAKDGDMIVAGEASDGFQTLDKVRCAANGICFCSIYRCPVAVASS